MSASLIGRTRRRPSRSWTTGRSHLLWLVPTCMAVHNLEEALTFPRYLPVVLERLPEAWRTIAGAITLGQVWAALAIVTLVPVVLAAWATRRPDVAAPVWVLLVIQATLFLNALWHIGVAIVLLEGYAPGLVTAVLVDVPCSIYLFRSAAIAVPRG